MNKKFLLMFVIAIFALVFIINLVHVQADCIGATTNFTCGDTISESCTLNQSETASVACFDVNADNIIIDCGGYTISSAFNNIDLIKISQYDNITIENCNLSGGEKAIYLDRSINSTIKNATILSLGAYPILLEYSNYTNITNITMPNNPGNNGKCIYFNESNNNNLSYSTISCGPSAEIMYLINGNSNTLFNNTFNGSGYDRIYIEGGGMNIINRNTIINGGGDSGISIWSGNNNLISNNTIINNSEGCSVWTNSNVFEHNNITSNNCGIYIDSASNSNITENILKNNGLDFFSRSSTNVLAINNTFNNTIISFTYNMDVKINSSQVPAGNPSNTKDINLSVDITEIVVESLGWFYLNVSYNESGLGSIDESLLKVWKYDTSWSEVSGSGVNTAQNYVYANITSFSIFAPMEQQPLPCGCNNGTYNYTCGDTITESCTMNCNLESTGTCFNIGADDITLDGGEYNINYSSAQTGYAINNSAGYDNVTIKNFNITQANNSNSEASAILFNNSANGTIEFNTIYTNGSLSPGIQLSNCFNYSIKDNNITNGGVFSGHWGIYLDYSNESEIYRNNLTNSYFVIYLSNSVENKIHDNNVSDSQDAVYLSSSHNNEIYGDSLNNNNIGVWLSNSENNTITNLTSFENWKGISLGGSSSGNLITNCNITYNTYGIEIQNSNNTLVKDSVITNSITNDIVGKGSSPSNSTLLNITHDKSTNSITQASTLFFKWYLDAYVNYSDSSPVSGAYVTAYDTNNNLLHNITTNAGGYIQRQNVTEYYETSTAKYYKTNYSVNASIEQQISQTELVNLTTNRITDDNTHIMLTMLYQLTNLNAIYESSIYTNTYFDIRANYTTNRSQSILGATCNLTIIPSLDGLGSSDFYVMGYNSGTGVYETLGLATSFPDTYSIVINCGKQYYQFQTGAGSFTVNEQSGGGGGGGSSPGQEPVCGNKQCEEGETCINCPNDCVCICGNGICEPGETYKTCSEDCCAPEGIQVNPPFNCCPGLIAVDDPEYPIISIKFCIRCGDGLCKEHENIKNCPEDCGICNFNIPIKIRLVEGTGGVVPKKPTQPSRSILPGLR